ncbi:MAG TPA: histidine kinase [Edaphobacter sp.]|nr:histidine kinase [Edaphobacter sp.]
MEQQLERSSNSFPHTPKTASLPFRGAIVVFAATIVMTFLTAIECHGYVVITHPDATIASLLLFAAIYWLWWGVLAIAMWTFAQRWPSTLTCTARTFMPHLVLACLLGVAHLVLLQRYLNFAAKHWGNPAAVPDNYLTVVRFGFELLLYGFILGFSGLLHAQAQSQKNAMRSLELEKQLSQAQLKALQMQMEPHFLFNTLNAVTTLVELKRNDEASETLAHLNTILRKTLQRNVPEKIPFAQELQVVESYLAIQQVRFADRLHVKIETTPDALEGLVPCFLLQPIVENAIRHGISRLEGEGLLETSVERIGDTLRLRVRDNGPGLTGSSASTGHGIGMQNTRDRLSYFYPGAYNFAAIEPEHGGYEVTIQIPYERSPA